MKTPYVAPVLRAHGTLEALTQGQSTGSMLDRSFVVGTPIVTITFS